MQLLSIQNLINDGVKSFLRFPFTLIMAFSAALSTIYYIETDLSSHAENLNMYLVINFIRASYLGIPLMLSLKLLALRFDFNTAKTVVLKIGGLAILTLYYFSLPEYFSESSLIRQVLFFIALHCFISFIPFLKKGNMNEFWEYNKTLFINFLIALLYIMVLFAGLALALAAIDILLGVNIDSQTYFELWIVMIVIFNLWFFLGKFPEKIETQSEELEYPFGLKVFTKYVLIPLVFIYLTILYAYTVKIIIEQQLPKGWVSFLILCYSVLGILSLLLVYPIQNFTGEKWIKQYARYFYFALFPLIILLFVAIFERIFQYGITEPRYFLIVLALWLTAISIYMLQNKNHNIKIIPISLCLIAFLSSFGPWSAFSVSRANQLYRFEKLLEKNNLLENGKIVKPISKPAFNDMEQISSIVSYIINDHSYTDLQPYVTFNLDTVYDNEHRYYDPELFTKYAQLPYVHSWDSQYSNNLYYLYSEQGNSNKVMNVKDFDFFFTYSHYYYPYDSLQATEDIYFEQKDSIKVLFDRKLSILTLNYKNRKVDFEMLKFFEEHKQKLSESNQSLSVPKLEIAAETDSFGVTLLFKNINYTTSYNDSLVELQEINANFLLRKKSKQKSK